MKNTSYFLYCAYILLVICLSGPALKAQTKDPVPEIKSIIAGFENAIIQKDTSLLAGIVDENFSVSTSTWPASGRLFLTIVNRTEVIESVRLVSDGASDTGKGRKKVAVEFRVREKDPVVSDVILNKENKIVYVDYFDQLYGKFRYGKSGLRAVIPFTYDNGIILTVRVNDYPEPLHFLFDSGADGAAVSAEVASTLGLKIDRQQSTSVVGGHMNIDVSTGNTFYLDTLALPNQGIAVFEKVKGEVDGILGLTLAKSFITRFDFDKMELSLFDFGDYTYETKGETLPLTVPSGVAVIPASMNIAGKGFVEGNFVLDTGANYCLIGFSPFVKKNKLLLESGFVPESQTSTVSMGITTPVFNGKAADFKLGKDLHLKNLPISLQASSNSNWKPGADGSIGVKLLSCYNFTINLMEKEIHMTPNNHAGSGL